MLVATQHSCVWEILINLSAGRKAFLCPCWIALICFVDNYMKMNQQTHLNRMKNLRRQGQEVQGRFEGKEQSRDCFHIWRKTARRSAEIKDVQLHHTLPLFCVLILSQHNQVPPITLRSWTDFTSTVSCCLQSCSLAAWTSVCVWLPTRSEFKFASAETLIWLVIV